MSDPPRRPTGPTAARPAPPAPAPIARRLPEPPPFRSQPLAPPGACVNCATPVTVRYATPRCWECGRILCADCYWRHGLTPTAHRCASCLARGTDDVPVSAISGGLRAATPATGSRPRGAP